MTSYIGLDGHCKTSTFAVIDEKGNLVSQNQVITCERDLLGIVRSLKGTKKLIFEESHLSQWFFALFKKEVDDVVVCHPGYLGRKQGAKTDLRDALHLAQELRCGHVVPVYHDQSRMMDLRVMISGYQDLVQEIVRTKNRYKAMFRSEAIKTPGVGVYRSDERIKELSRSTSQFVAEQLFAQIQALEAQKKLYQSRFQKNLKLYPDIKRLTAIPGIENIRANVIAAIICSPHRFENKHKLWAYAMLVKYEQTSDDVSYGKIRVAGRRDLKEAFIGAAESILRMTQSPLKDYYSHQRGKGVSHHSAKLALARKVATICLAVLKHKQPYKEDLIRDALK